MMSPKLACPQCGSEDISQRIIRDEHGVYNPDAGINAECNACHHQFHIAPQRFDPNVKSLSTGHQWKIYTPGMELNDSASVFIPFEGDQYRVEFPEECVYCGAANPGHIGVKSSTTTQVVEQRTRTITYSMGAGVYLPCCDTHIAEARRNKTIKSRVNIGITVLAALLLALPLTGVILLATGPRRADDTVATFILAAVCALVPGGMVGAVFGSSVIRRLAEMRASLQSLTVPSEDHVLGATVVVAKQGLILSFIRPDYTQKVLEMNPHALVAYMN